MKDIFKEATNWMMRNPEYVILSLIVIAVAFIAFHAGQASVIAATVIPGVAGGSHITGEPLTTDLAREASPSLLLNEIDQQIVKIRPMATPIDQFIKACRQQTCRIDDCGLL